MNLRAGVIGCGNISRFHFSALEQVGSAGQGAGQGAGQHAGQHAGATVSMVCDVHKEAMAPYARRFGCAATTDWRDVVASPNVDVVHVTLLSRLHREICLEAIENGKAVICEKTLTEKPEDSLEIVKAARDKGVSFYTSYMKRFIPAVEKAANLLPALGTLMSASMHSYQGWGDNWDGQPAGDFFSRGESGDSPVKRAYGGGVLVCGGSHILDLLCFLFGRPKSLFATMYQPDYLDLDLECTALITTDSCPVQFQVLAHPLRSIGFLRDGWDEGFVILGSKGRLELFSSNWSEVDNKASLLVHYDNASGKTVEYGYEAVSPFSRAIEFFYTNIAKGVQGAQSVATGYDVDLLIQAIGRSASSGAPAPLKWDIEL